MKELNPLLTGNLGSAVFFPRPDMPYGQEAAGVRDHLFKVEQDVTLRLRLFMGEKHWPTILFFHGNGETARDYDALSSVFNELQMSFVVAEYRGYGPSTGTPCLGTILPDAQRTLDELKTILEGEARSGSIIVMGRSLGSAPAIELASARSDDLKGLVIESGFAYIVPLLELIGVPVVELNIEEKHGPMNLDKISTIKMPTLIIHAEQDQIIPISDGEALENAALDPQKVFLAVPGAGHNDIQFVAGQTYFDHVAALVRRCTEEK